MFEALVTLCAIAAGPQACRAVLLPGYAAENQAACETALKANPPEWLATYGKWVASCAPRPASTLAFVEIAPGVFVHRGQIAEPNAQNAGDIANIGFIVGKNSIAVIDAGGSRKVGEQLYLATRAQSTLPIAYLILTHMHPDHVFGAEVLPEAGATILGHNGLPRALSDRAETYQTNFARLIGPAGYVASRIVGPDQTLSIAHTIDLGDRELQIVPWPTAHTATDLTVFDPTSGVLFAGDLLFDEQIPALDGALRGWRTVLADLQQLPATLDVPGHGAPVLHWPQAALPQARYLDVLEKDTRAALAAGLSLATATDAIAQSEAENWQMFDLYNQRNAIAAYTELEWE
ncbi:MAG: quinoprotein relay system zinc metallohydrolase 2 [Candidatus Saccharibacteria bacterium]|nr:quinoprotein relay system zinc metallohydrolase 2 [Pseudorhodobacter sp.]